MTPLFTVIKSFGAETDIATVGPTVGQTMIDDVSPEKIFGPWEELSTDTQVVWRAITTCIVMVTLLKISGGEIGPAQMDHMVATVMAPPDPDEEEAVH